MGIVAFSFHLVMSFCDLVILQKIAKLTVELIYSVIILSSSLGNRSPYFFVLENGQFIGSLMLQIFCPLTDEIR